MSFALILANVAVFLVELLVGPSFVERFALWPAASAAFRIWQLLSYSLLHAGIVHLAYNMMGLALFGRDLERLLGSARFLVLYVCSVLAGGLAQLAVEQATSTAATPTVGASAGVFGLLAAYAVRLPKRRVILLFPPIAMPVWLFVTGYALVELLSGVSGDAGVAHFAHLGGMLGAIACLVLCRPARASGA
ncbi:rhomboid family intramembrane serine protease [Burkholderia gladioli]|uniref:rhomboid family intramembrane serine protease n=1 Tax=Burkholderia gladioli TaxID=28095 RepID=UPI00163F66C5|nr:rhomboid family intramembrane serine protease [Burkholderia gladioli]